MSLWLKRALPLVIIAVALLVASLMNAQQDAPVRQPKAPPSPAVDVAPVVFAPMRLWVKSQGTVMPRQQIEWASEVAGRVVWVSPDFVDGNRVDAGAVLLRLDDTEYRAAVAQAESTLADARLAMAEERAELRRGTAYHAQQSDTASGSLRQPKMQQVEARVAAAEEQLKKVQQDLARTEITAPFAGVIDGKAADLGQYVSSGAVLFALSGTDVAEVRLPVTAGDIGFIDHAAIGSGHPPRVLLQASLGNQQQLWEATLVRTENRVDAELRTFYVVAELQRPYDKTQFETPLVLGMFVDARIEGKNIPAGMRLPRNAVHDDNFVYVVEQGRLQRREIPIYRHEHDSVIVTKGIEAGERVAISRLDLMVEGMPVTAVLDADITQAETTVAAGNVPE